jgi:hypothetical protein
MDLLVSWNFLRSKKRSFATGRKTSKDKEGNEELEWVNLGQKGKK